MPRSAHWSRPKPWPRRFRQCRRSKRPSKDEEPERLPQTLLTPVGRKHSHEPESSNGNHRMEPPNVRQQVRRSDIERDIEQNIERVVEPTPAIWARRSDPKPRAGRIAVRAAHGGRVVMRGVEGKAGKRRFGFSCVLLAIAVVTYFAVWGYSSFAADWKAKADIPQIDPILKIIKGLRQYQQVNADISANLRSSRSPGLEAPSRLRRRRSLHRTAELLLPLHLCQSNPLHTVGCAHGHSCRRSRFLLPRPDTGGQREVERSGARSQRSEQHQWRSHVHATGHAGNDQAGPTAAKEKIARCGGCLSHHLDRRRRRAPAAPPAISLSVRKTQTGKAPEPAHSSAKTATTSPTAKLTASSIPQRTTRQRRPDPFLGEV